MVYITVKQSPMTHQMTLEEFLFDKEVKFQNYNPNMTNTRTYKVEEVSDYFLNKISVREMISKLNQFNETYEHLRNVPRHDLYREFYIPKKSGGLRRIDAPNDELMGALRTLKSILENSFQVLYHTSAFAYIKGRSTIDAIKRHQANESKWFGKYDLSNFFGSTTLEYVLSMFQMIFPFSEVMKREEGYKALEKALELAFLDGVLPQGTPVSPLITNVMMIPVDFELANCLRDFEHQHFVYTRYADDFIISSKYNFDFRKIEHVITSKLSSFNAPFGINSKKTRYGSSSGSNWNLGVMLNKDNQITVGYQAKRRLKAMLTSYVLDKKNGKTWDKSDIQVMEGLRSYYKMVEGSAIDDIVKHIGEKFQVDVMAMIKQDLRTV